MPCYHPLKAWQRSEGAPLSFHEPIGMMLEVPCGQCIGCRLERSRQWAVRIMHEASLHEDNCFVTLTYDEAHLPSDGSLRKRDFQLFCKRMRKALGPFRFFHCGEYGEDFKRPHYHACLFGVNFADRVHFKRSPNGDWLDTSVVLDGLWGHGFCSIGSLTFESAAYVARYVLKKVTGDAAEQHYERVSEFGEVYSIQPEYVTMSRRPGIAYEWFRKFGSEVFPSDEVISRGFAARPPRYYDNLLAESEPSVFDFIKGERKRALEEVSEDVRPERLRVREIVCKARVKSLRREYES